MHDIIAIHNMIGTDCKLELITYILGHLKLDHYYLTTVIVSDDNGAY